MLLKKCGPWVSNISIKMQNYKLHPRPTKTESVVQQDLQVVVMYIEV